MSRAAHYEKAHVCDTSQHGNGFKQPWNTESFITIWSSYVNMTSSKGQCQILAGLFKKTNTVYLRDRSFSDKHCSEASRQASEVWVWDLERQSQLCKQYFCPSLDYFWWRTSQSEFSPQKLFRCKSRPHKRHNYWDEIKFLHRYEEIKATQTFFWKAMTRLHLLYFLPGDAGQGDLWVFVYDWTHTTSYELQIIIQKQED